MVSLCLDLVETQFSFTSGVEPCTMLASETCGLTSYSQASVRLLPPIGLCFAGISSFLLSLFFVWFLLLFVLYRFFSTLPSFSSPVHNIHNFQWLTYVFFFGYEVELHVDFDLITELILKPTSKET